MTRPQAKLSIVWLALILWIPAWAEPAAPEHGGALRVLLLGNSYTYQNDLPSLLERLSLESNTKPPIIALMIARGGATLERHAADRSALTRIRDGNWDWVILQEQSMRPIQDPQRMRRWARVLNGQIEKAESSPRTMLFMTWARRGRPGMLQPIQRAYRSVGQDLGATVAPVGEAWSHALEQNPAVLLHAPDGSHPNAAGSYLAACVIWSKLYGASPVGLPALDIDPELARTLQLSAEAVAELEPARLAAE